MYRARKTGRERVPPSFTFLPGSEHEPATPTSPSSSLSRNPNVSGNSNANNASRFHVTGVFTPPAAAPPEPAAESPRTASPRASPEKAAAPGSLGELPSKPSFFSFPSFNRTPATSTTSLRTTSSDAAKRRFPDRTAAHAEASWLSRLVFSWVGGLHKDTSKGQRLTEQVEWDIPERLTCDDAVERLGREWAGELERAKLADASHASTILSSGTASSRFSFRNGSSFYDKSFSGMSPSSTKKKRPSFRRALCRAYRREILWMAAHMCLWLLFALCSNCVLVFYTIQAVQRCTGTRCERPEASKNGSMGNTWWVGDMEIVVVDSDHGAAVVGIVCAVLIGVCEVLRSLSINQHWWSAVQAGMSARAAVSVMVFEKYMKRRSSRRSAEQDEETNTTNLMISDAQRVSDLFQYGMFVVAAPFTLLIVVLAGCAVLSAAFVLGFALLILSGPLLRWLSRLAQKQRSEAVKITDQRVSLMTEILNAIKLVKMYAWEDSFAERVAGVREREIRHLLRSANIKADGQALTLTLPLLVLFVTFTLHTLGMHHRLQAQRAFTVVGLLNVARFPLTVLPQAMRAVAEGYIALRRIESELLNLSEELIPEESPAVNEDGAKEIIRLVDAAFVWESRRAVALRVPKLTIPRGALVGVAGRLGSGKTTLLSGALLGEARRVEGSCVLSLLPTHRIGYVSQSPFVFNGTLLANITFGSLGPIDDARLSAVVKACALEQDIEAFGVAGIYTELGEKGVNASGGQRARIALARALYDQRADLLILDDVLSAVDANVREQIWSEISHRDPTSLRGNRTVLSAMHAVDLLSTCDLIVVCNKGVVEEAATYPSLIASLGSKDELDRILGGTTLSAAQSTHRRESTKNALRNTFDSAQHASVMHSMSATMTMTTTLTHGPPPAGPKAGQLTTVEDRAAGAVRWSTVTRFVRHCGGAPRLAGAYGLMVLNEALLAGGAGFWIAAWCNDSVFNGNNALYVAVTAGILLASFLVALATGRVWARTMLRGARALHDEAFAALMRAKLTYFDVTPLGRVLARFTNDVDRVDAALGEAVETAASLLTRSVISFVVVCVVFYWFVLALVPLLASYAYMYVWFRPSLRETKRVQLESQSKLVSHVQSSASGLTTLRAWNRLDATKTLGRAVVDATTKTQFAFMATSRWSAVRLDAVTSIGALITSLLAVMLAPHLTPGFAGLAVTSMLSCSGFFQFAARQLIESEAHFTSVERLVGFATTVPKELGPTAFRPPTPDWPAHGKIGFEGDVMAKYRANTPFILKGLNLIIPGGIVCALCGRTGSGKSSLLLGLFNMLSLTNGRITIDDVDIKSVPLPQLRRRVLSIIPQDPVLFHGTLRFNLDPFEEHTDAACLDALRRAKFETAPDAATLDARVVDDGRNFSAGERQLVCFARALLRDSRIVCIDEGTSAVDANTSFDLGNDVRALFPGKTVLIVAHRMDIVASLDAVAVLDDGKLAEFGSPRELLRDPDGHFARMMTLSAQTLEGALFMPDED